MKPATGNCSQWTVMKINRDGSVLYDAMSGKMTDFGSLPPVDEWSKE